MANTWVASSQSVAFASGKSMLDVFNKTGSARVIRVYRILCFNSQTATVTGVWAQLRIYRITTASSGSTVTPFPKDTTNTAISSSNTDAGTGRTTTRTDLLRQVWWTTDQVAVDNTIKTWSTYLPVATIWNAGYKETTIQPIVCPADNGVNVYNNNATAVGTADFEIEFTDAGS